MSIATIQPEELKYLFEQGQVLDMIDVRMPFEHRAVHVRGVRLLPLDSLTVEAVCRERPLQAVGPTYVLCQGGSRAGQAARRLVAAGQQAVVVEGGTQACVAAGLPVVRGKAAMSLQRQSLLGAAVVIWIGLLLSWFVHPAFIGITAFAGLGLMIAGLFDICLMAIVLGRMPWNRVTDSCRTNRGSLSCSLKGATP